MTPNEEKKSVETTTEEKIRIRTFWNYDGCDGVAETRNSAFNGEL